MTPCFECFSQKCEGITEPRPIYIRFKYPVSNCCVCSNIKIYVFTLFFVFSKQQCVEMTINASICDFLFSWIPRLCSFAFFWLFHLLTLKPFLFRLFSSLICLDGWSPEIIVSEIQFDSYLTTCHSDQISRYLTGTTPVFKLFLLNLLSIFFLSASLSERGLGVVNAL